MPFGLDGLFDILVELVKWLGNFAQANPWPTATIIIFSVIVFVPWARFRIKDLFNALGIRKLKISGTEFEFGREDKLAVQRSLDESFEMIQVFRKKIDHNVDRLTRKTGLDNALAGVARVIFREFFNNDYGKNNARATIHMQDFIFSDRLYQATDYYPRGGGKHRHFSLRKGIIGRVWRSQVAASAGFLTTREAPSNAENIAKQVENAVVEEISKEWGLTTPEALDFLKSPSYCCVPIHAGPRVVGLFYMDCGENNFGWKGGDIKGQLNRLEKRCKQEVEAQKIGELLAQIDSEMADQSPRRSLDENLK